MSRNDYVPANATQFNAFLKKIIEYTNGRMHLWTTIPEARLTALKNARIDFDEALQAAVELPTKGKILARREAQAAATKELRGFVNQFLHFDPVTNADRAEMGIPNHDTIRTDHVEVHEHVEFELGVQNVKEVSINFWVKEANNKAKPMGYDGAVIVWDVLDDAPTEPEELGQHAMASRTPHTLTFKEAQRGKHVYVSLAWQNERGNRGPWTPIRGTIVP